METLLSERSAYVERDGDTIVLSNEADVQFEISADAFREAQEAIAAGEDATVEGLDFVRQNVGFGMDMYVAEEGDEAKVGAAIGYVADSLTSVDV